MNGRSVDAWMGHEPVDEWEAMMKKVAAFHHKHDFAGQNGHDMGYRLALTIEELGELAAAVTKGKPLEECAEEMADVLILLMGPVWPWNWTSKQPLRKNTLESCSAKPCRVDLVFG